MTNDNDKPNIIDSQTNARNLDVVGGILLKFAKGSKSIDPDTATMLAYLLAECRNYSTLRDADTLDDDTSKFMLPYLTGGSAMNPPCEEVSASDVADEIIKDLRKSGINL